MRRRGARAKSGAGRRLSADELVAFEGGGDSAAAVIAANDFTHAAETDGSGESGDRETDVIFDRLTDFEVLLRLEKEHAAAR